MAKDFDSDYLGGVDDRVTLTLGTDDVKIAEAYEVHQAVLSQPGQFAITMGYGEVIEQLISRYSANTKFGLKIGGSPRMSGRTDGVHVTQNDHATTLIIRGRDAIAPLHDGFIQVEKSFTAHTYAEMVAAAFDNVGFTGNIAFTNDANRQLEVGVAIDVSSTEDGSIEEIAPAGAAGSTDTQGSVFRQLQAKVGERWYHFVKRELDRGGLMLWAAADGGVILSRPNAKQAPTYRIVRRRGQPINEVNVLSVDFKEETTGRFSECLVYGRYGGKKYGRAKAKGLFVDQEMVDIGYDRPLVVHDVNIANPKQAAFLASRRLAESRRANWSLQYTVAGHTVPAIGGKGRSVWAPDTVVDVDDQELGLKGSYWIESVTFRRPPTTTTLVLMRPEDLLFGLVE